MTSIKIIYILGKLCAILLRNEILRQSGLQIILKVNAFSFQN